MRWDSDHVASFDDETRDIMCQAVRCGLDRVLIATDFFDASINRISAWITGIRSVQKALLFALLEPEGLGRLQDEGDYTALQVRLEESKMLPIGDVWSEFLRRSGVKEDYLGAVREYEKTVLSLRKK